MNPRKERGGGVIEIRSVNGHATLAVEAKSSFGPRDVDRLLGSAGRTLRELSPGIVILVVAPWLSPRTRELLAQQDVRYLDLTGNASIRLDNPALFIRTDGAQRDPSPPRGKARVRGPKAGRLIRWLVDVRPPYGVRELAAAANLTPGYVSRLLDALDEEALVQRSRRGRVERADVEGLLRRWAETYDVFASNETTTFLAREGVPAAVGRLAAGALNSRIALTGSLAAVRLAPVARPALLCAYVDDPDAVAESLDLLVADEGANVALLRPTDPVVWEHCTVEGGVRYVAPSQAVVDGLTGNGRMPAEGEALLQWMLTDESRWRASSLDGSVEP